MELPEVTFFDDFYFWFNTETKKEYYATPLYFYKADYHLDTENKLRDVYYKETEKTDNGLKHPASIYFPFHEKFGLLLLRFLNADLSSYETANKTFFYAYGFEILKNLANGYVFELSNSVKRKKQVKSITYNSINPIINNCLNYALKNLDKYKQQAIEILKFGINYNRKKAANIDFSSCYICNELGALKNIKDEDFYELIILFIYHKYAKCTQKFLKSLK